MGAPARVMLKLSGEVLGGPSGVGLDRQALHELAQAIAAVAADIQLAVVVGGGNILRGAHNNIGVERATGDYMGMMATIINAMALQGAVENCAVQSRVLSAIETPQVAEFFIRRRAIRHMEKGRVVILAAGTGNPYFTTDTAAALRATELGCDLLLKATKVDGIYSADPNKDATAERYTKLTYRECINQNLQVMDQTAFSLCMENGMPIVVFSVHDRENIGRAARGEPGVGTRVE